MARKPGHRCCSVLNFGQVNNTSGNQRNFMPVICGLYARWYLQVNKYCDSALTII